jgi:hypothetical protein
MTDIILHHYETSPYSEKVRLGLGLKGLTWGSAEIPVIILAIPDSGWKSARSEKIGRIVTYPTNRHLSNNKRN